MEGLEAQELTKTKNVIAYFEYVAGIVNLCLPSKNKLVSFLLPPK